jgi:hypothetical protein
MFSGPVHSSQLVYKNRSARRDVSGRCRSRTAWAGCRSRRTPPRLGLCVIFVALFLGSARSLPESTELLKLQKKFVINMCGLRLEGPSVRVG